MKNDSDYNRLLRDIFDDAAPPAFREELLTRALAEARGRRRTRPLRQGTIALALLVAISWLAWTQRPVRQFPAPRIASSLNVVTSHSLDPSMLVRTAPGALTLIASTPDAVTVLQTQSAAQSFHELSDDELLAMTRGLPTVLVREGPHQAELLIVDGTTITPSQPQ
jgi:hypothetical protein